MIKLSEILNAPKRVRNTLNGFEFIASAVASGNPFARPIDSGGFHEGAISGHVIGIAAWEVGAHPVSRARHRLLAAEEREQWLSNLELV